MPEVALSSKHRSIAAALLILAAIACNLPGATPTPVPTSTNIMTPSPTSGPAQPTSAAPETVPAVVATGTGGDASLTPLPTFTPIQPPTLAPTRESSKTPNPKPTTAIDEVSTRTPRASATPNASSGPLSFDYRIEWRLKDASAAEAIAKVTIMAKGGGGDYQYYRDELPVDGPIFEYFWRTCSGNPGSLRVTSADGQSVVTNYFENPPCPTPTPTP